MKLNVISDLHCSFDAKLNKVIWNSINENYLSISDEQDETIQLIKKFKKEVEDHKSQIENFDVAKLFPKDRWYPYKKKCKSFSECITLIDKILTFVESPKLKEILRIVDMCYAVIYYVKKIIIPRIDFAKVIDYLFKRVSRFDPEKLKPADYLIVAGDLGTNENYKQVYEELKEKTKGKFKDVLFIKGNHDYWVHDYDVTEMNLNDRFVEKVDGDYVFLGCTLWAPLVKDTYAASCCWRMMNDYYYIPKFNIDVVNKLYKEESEWLRSKCKEHQGKKIVIFTHHNPIQELIDNDYRHSQVNDAYCVMDHSCDDIKPLVWICGHSHSYKDITKNGVRYYRNPIGYREMYGFLPSEVSSKHWYNGIIEV